MKLKQQYSVFFSYAIITHNKVSLFVNANQLDESAHKYLDGVIDIHPYEAFLPYLKDLASELQLDKENVRIIISLIIIIIAPCCSYDD